MTFPQRHVEPLSSCSCRPLTDDEVADIELPGDQQDQIVFPSEPQVPMGLVHAPVVEPQGFAGVHIPVPESVWVNGKELTVESRVRDLQDARNYLGLNASGAKKKLYDRLAKYVEVHYQKDIVISKNTEQEMRGPQPKTQGRASEMPSNPLEVEQHEVTHLPFASWCDVCVRTKSREDPTVHNADMEREPTGIPHIQLDWMFGKPYHKGRAAKVERYIQTVKRQASSLMVSVEDKIHETLPDHHSLRAWALIHIVYSC